MSKKAPKASDMGVPSKLIDALCAAFPGSPRQAIIKGMAKRTAYESKRQAMILLCPEWARPIHEGKAMPAASKNNMQPFFAMWRRWPWCAIGDTEAVSNCEAPPWVDGGLAAERPATDPIRACLEYLDVHADMLPARSSFRGLFTFPNPWQDIDHLPDGQLFAGAPLPGMFHLWKQARVAEALAFIMHNADASIEIKRSLADPKPANIADALILAQAPPSVAQENAPTKPAEPAKPKVRNGQNPARWLGFNKRNILRYLRDKHPPGKPAKRTVIATEASKGNPNRGKYQTILRALNILAAAGWLTKHGDDGWCLSELGLRGVNETVPR